MSMFADLNLDDPSIPNDPNLLPDNTYPCFVYEVKPHASKAGDPGVKFIYKISEGTFSGRTITEWKSLGIKPGIDPEKALKAKSYIKERLVSLGVATKDMSGLDTEDLIGKECYVSIRNQDGFPNVQRVTRNTDGAFAADSPTDFGI